MNTPSPRGIFFKYLIMYRILILFLLPLIILACKNESKSSDHELKKQKVEISPFLNKEQDIKNNDGHVTRSVKFLDNGIKTVTDFYEGSDKIYTIRYFKDDLQDGKTIGYHPNGKIREVQYFNKGKQEGKDSIFYETGELRYIYSFDNDMRNGWMYRYSKEGKQEFAVKYKDDKVEQVIDSVKINSKK